MSNFVFVPTKQFYFVFIMQSTAAMASSRDDGSDMVPNLMRRDDSRFSSMETATDYIRAAMQRIQKDMEEANLEEQHQTTTSSSSGTGRRRRSMLTYDSGDVSYYESTPSAPAEFDVSSYISHMRKQYEAENEAQDPSKASSSSPPLFIKDQIEEVKEIPLDDALEEQAKTDIKEAAEQINAAIDDEETVTEEQEPKDDEDESQESKPNKSSIIPGKKTKRTASTRKAAGKQKARKSSRTASPRSHGSGDDEEETEE